MVLEDETDLTPTKPRQVIGRQGMWVLAANRTLLPLSDGPALRGCTAAYSCPSRSVPRSPVIRRRQLQSDVHQYLQRFRAGRVFLLQMLDDDCGHSGFDDKRRQPLCDGFRNLDRYRRLKGTNLATGGDELSDGDRLAVVPEVESVGEALGANRGKCSRRSRSHPGNRWDVCNHTRPRRGAN